MKTLNELRDEYVDIKARRKRAAERVQELQAEIDRTDQEEKDLRDAEYKASRAVLRAVLGDAETEAA
ncbi:hypothetical protein AKJ09_03677 [Labilithrix luteola]|uniref:Uncharacterized protein n=1 Tax=Labilithrix luteola TaxID=1391654 RepID=A0A0K1PTZ5_9BACT|nr:hypothetical protein [Labilithrix luteola]AKU97013.1 hypothetical protein AKJ09_03677 [Labilithrix luteola]